MSDFDRFTRTLSQVAELEVGRLKPQRLLLKVTEDGQHQEHEFTGPKIVIGAHPNADLQLCSASVSELHCELTITDAGNIQLRDLGSKNGTLVAGGIRIHEATISPGASFSAGSSTVTVVRVEEESVPLSRSDRFGPLLGRGAKMAELFARLSRMAAFDLDVLVHGETGTGKELVARGLHEASSRAAGPFIILDSTALNSGIAESVLFGHRRGAFTGADRDRAGLFEESNGGTLFIDEIGDLPLELQPKLLRALENRTTRRVGDSEYRNFDARIISATHCDLPKMVNEGRFREDLYFRLGQVHAAVPALRERDPSNISLLADHFLGRFLETRGDSPATGFNREAYAALKRHEWRGNVRQLKNAIEVAAAMATTSTLGPDDLWLNNATPAGSSLFEHNWKDSLAAFERRYAELALQRTEGNRSAAARAAGMSRNGFSNLLKRVGLA